MSPIFTHRLTAAVVCGGNFASFSQALSQAEQACLSFAFPRWEEDEARWRRLRTEHAFLALVLTTVTLLALAPQSIRTSSEQPFRANFITQFTSVLEFPLLHLTVHNKENATYMGTTSAFTDDQVSNLIDGSGVCYLHADPPGMGIHSSSPWWFSPGARSTWKGGAFFRQLYNHRRHRPIQRCHW